MIILAIDCGTSAVKALLLSPAEQGGWVLKSRAVQQVTEPSPAAGVPGSVEQNAEAWWDAACAASKAVLAESPEAANAVEAIGISGIMQTLILCGVDSVALRPALLYSDTRGTVEATELEQTIGRDRLLAETANFKGAASILPKLMWLKKHDPSSLAAASLILLGAHDYLYTRLTGVSSAACTDLTNAATTGLLRAGASAWHDALLTEAGFAELLPKLPKLSVTPADSVAPLSASAAAQLGLHTTQRTIRVCHGAGDLGTTTIGALAPLGGIGAYCYLGTSGWVACAAHSDTLSAPRAFGVRHPRAGVSIAAAPMTTAGGHLSWLAKALYPDVEESAAYARIEEEASLAAADAGGVLFLPYLAGERCPIEDPHARACWIGMSGATGRKEMCRSVLLGIAFALRSLLMLLPASDGGSDGGGGGGGADSGRGGGALVLVGGAARSRVLQQTLADVLQRVVVVPSQPQDVGALGAAELCAEAMGLKVLPAGAADISDGASAADAQVSRAVPNAALAPCLDAAFEAFCGAHPSLKETFGRLAAAPRA